jgi:hypothetical protein
MFRVVCGKSGNFMLVSCGPAGARATMRIEKNCEIPKKKCNKSGGSVHLVIAGTGWTCGQARHTDGGQAYVFQVRKAPGGIIRL